ncbi:phage shock protein C (PspC) family protein [Lentzea xinjiangensis]|uniref:Phage shock protein C (PspC) family protein n=2 Tax=Lentzea xinjiangensis TaxID=402600 RepID=A0A1H9BN85_9PSEU|nr:ATP-binding protein [Lentzea xinjiangensis]SEP90339.1 phage shock protein C (PspC) family protein [Lentzea xinjiangensis]
MRRRRTGRVVAGVASGLADHLGAPVFWVRAVFAVLAAFSGAGIIAYGLFWMFVPQSAVVEPETEADRKEWQQAVGLAALGVGVAVFTGLLGGTWSGWVTGPVAVALVGAAVVWREADEAQRRRWRDGAFSQGKAGIVRTTAGGALVVAGVAAFLVVNDSVQNLSSVVLSVLATLIGVAVLTVPLWMRLVRDLDAERRARIRTEERAEIAAHLHDSVLQTLALIQKQSESPREVKRLARSQERELRSWLYGRDLGELGEQPATISVAIAQTCAEVEDAFAIAVSQVVVGDCELEDGMFALVQASKEAVVNAAKHAGVGEVSVYAEVEPDKVTVFVRDRGKGFDPDAVPEDRHGLAGSIRGRMDRHGGEVRLRTAPGEGTEVQLEMPRKTEART